ncbi:MAG: hypothetical protein KC502_09280 [Myxococcales bacterium]|nr:hypothetical protein [Myxococcales bacterium]
MSQAAGPSPDIARFGAALLRGAEEEQVTESIASYKVKARFPDIADFYQAIYGKQDGVVVEVDEAAIMISVAVGKAVQDADFSTLIVSPHPGGEVNRFQIIVMAKGPDDGEDEDYPDSSPWAIPG